MRQSVGIARAAIADGWVAGAQPWIDCVALVQLFLYRPQFIPLILVCNPHAEAVFGKKMQMLGGKI